MTTLDDKINNHFAGLVVRKDLVKEVKGNAIVPSYVLEYLLGQYCATNDPDSIESGINMVKEILRRHYVHRNQAELIKSNIREKGLYKVIDKISASLNEKADVYEASFSNLGINKVLIDSQTIQEHPKLLVGGVWCIAEVEYEHSDDGRRSPWILVSLKPIQLSQFDFEGYLEARKQFSTDEWIDLLIQSIGFNPELFGRRSKLTQLLRLIPFCERNYNLMELGPKGTGKSHIFSEFSPHGMLISGGEVTVPKMFVNNSNGRIGLVGYWDCVAFDEFAGKKKTVNKALVDIMKNYMANKSFSRGVETIGAEASLTFVGNTKHSVAHMLKHSDLFDELPEKFHDSAFLDRIHYYIPGWEVDIIRGEMFSDGFGFVVDYLAEILKHLRNYDYSNKYQQHFTLSSDISTRDRDGIHKTFSGLMKILFPHNEYTKEEALEVLNFAMEGRKRVKDQLMRIDATYSGVSFHFVDNEGEKHTTTTLEETEYPSFYHQVLQEEDPNEPSTTVEDAQTVSEEQGLQPGHQEVKENQKGISFDELFGAYLEEASVITLTDPYIKIFFQRRNFMEFLETILKFKESGQDLKVHLVTTKADSYEYYKQDDDFEKMKMAVAPHGIDLSWEYDATNTIHARHIVTDTGWKITLDRGLDIFQRYEMNDSLSLANRMQQFRSCKAFEITYIKL